jgi:transposase-like protein
MSVRCHRCGSEQYRKNGSYQGVQRYRCKDCGAYFTAQPRKFDYSVKQRALDMTCA